MCQIKGRGLAQLAATLGSHLLLAISGTYLSQITRGCQHCLLRGPWEELGNVLYMERRILAMLAEAFASKLQLDHCLSYRVPLVPARLLHCEVWAPQVLVPACARPLQTKRQVTVRHRPTGPPVPVQHRPTVAQDQGSARKHHSHQESVAKTRLAPRQW